MRPREKVPPKENRNPIKTSRPEATASMPDSPPVEEEQQPPQANTEVVLDSALEGNNPTQVYQELDTKPARDGDESQPR